MDKTCKNCEFWGDGGNGFYSPWEFCHKIPISRNTISPTPKTAVVIAHGSDDEGMDAELRTGPDFGCSLFEPLGEDSES